MPTARQVEAIDVRGVVPEEISDPGNAGAISVARPGHINIVTAGAETRTLAAPTFLGQRLVLNMKTDAGDCVVTVASAFNAAGNTIITLNDVGDFVELVGGLSASGAFRWVLVVNQGAALS
jgi:hypothetical protein